MPLDSFLFHQLMDFSLLQERDIKVALLSSFFKGIGCKDDLGAIRGPCRVGAVFREGWYLSRLPPWLGYPDLSFAGGKGDFGAVR